MRNDTLFLLFISLFLFSCENEKTTYSDLLKEEKKIINSFIAKNGFTILEEFPSEGIFGEKEFVLLKNGVYLQVIDYGASQNTPVGTNVLTIAKGVIIEKDKDKTFNGFEPEKDWAKWPVDFTYKERTHPAQSLYQDEWFVGEGYMSVLKYVGDGAIVKMIVPSNVGSYYQNRNFAPIYFEKVNFTYKKQ